jgi:cytosine/adenosine deaminase-related metal-dependent hydrolase
MKKTLLLPKRIVTANPSDSILYNHAIEIHGSKITDIKKVTEAEVRQFDGEVVKAEHLTVVPGFVQTHIHLCQTLFRGLADNLELLDWLQKRIFPCENAHSPSSLRSAVQLGLYELMMGGTTTLLDMGTMRHQETVFDELISSGMRAVAGKCMIDENDMYPAFCSDTKTELSQSYDLAKAFHNAEDGRIKYGFAPRFVLSCSEKLLIETKGLMKDFDGSILHTHSSENRGEIEEVRRRHNKENIDYFDSINLLDDHSVFAHCVHVNDKEIKLLKEKQGRVAHCPSSNLKLASGIAPIHKYLQEGVHVSLGADGAPCNNTLSIFSEMRLAALLQKPFNGPLSTDAKTVFRMATIKGAEALHLQNSIGSIEVGKKADLVCIDLESPLFPLFESDESVYSAIVYSATAEHVNDVMIDGKWIVRDSRHQSYEKAQVVSTAKTELRALIQRAQIQV